MAQLTFARKERKYLLSEMQYRILCEEILPRIRPDKYANYTICNIYYDTPAFDLIRRSIEKTDKPVYKEKLRLRSYGPVGEADPVFLELKKKYKGTVYKRRITLSYAEAIAYLEQGVAPPTAQPQILREMDAFLQYHHPVPALYLAYDREAYSGKEQKDLRVTFDRNIRFRWENIDLLQDKGALLLPQGTVLLELKLPMAMPLWLVRALDQIEAKPISFSKYGEIYKKYLTTRRKSYVYNDIQ